MFEVTSLSFLRLQLGIVQELKKLLIDDLPSGVRLLVRSSQHTLARDPLIYERAT